MDGHMAGVASGDSTSAIAETILGMNRFAAGVPADDATCNAIIGMLKGLSDGDYDSPFRSATVATWQGNDGPPYRGGQDVPFAVTEDHFVEIGFYTKEEGLGDLVAFFRTKAQPTFCNQYHTKPATPEGLRDLIVDVRKMAKDLRARGVCPRCSDPATAFLRLPAADFCPRCCLAAAIDCDAAERRWR